MYLNTFPKTIRRESCVAIRNLHLLFDDTNYSETMQAVIPGVLNCSNPSSLNEVFGIKTHHI